MGLFDFLRSSKPTTAAPAALRAGEPDSPEQAARRAVAAVMANISAPPGMVEAFAERFVTTHASGRSDSGPALADSFASSDWVWPELDHWKERFGAERRWPAMWGRLDEPAPAFPLTPQACVSWLNVAEMKALLQQRGLTPKPMPNKRADIEKALTSAISLFDLQQHVSPIQKAAVVEHVKKQAQARYSLLLHTLLMRKSSEILAARVERLSASGMKVRLQLLDSDCPVEQEFVRRYRSGKLTGMPPFFPGDRNCLIADVKV